MRPLIHVAAAFISGILFSGYVELPGVLYWSLLGLSVLVVLALWVFRRKYSPALIISIFFALGALAIIPYVRPDIPADDITRFIGSEGSATGSASLGVDVEGVVAGAPELRGERTRLFVDAELVHTAEGTEPVSGRVMLTVLAELPTLRDGDRIRFLAPLTRPWRYGNPGEFDYAGWLGVRGVHATVFVKSARFVVRAPGPGDVDSNAGWVAADAATRPGAGVSGVRESMRRLIDSSGARYPGALKALITGDKHAVDPALRAAFRDTGTAHLMAISGLHVGMVAFFSYWAVILLLKRSERLMLAFEVRKAALLLTLPPVFFYGMLAGFPLSTQRAVVMVAAFVVAYAIGRGREHYNTLALAALVILVAAPYSVWEVSFQLSFVAVFSIIHIAPELTRVFERVTISRSAEDPLLSPGRFERVRLSIFRWLCPAVAVTVAAGLGTAPLIALHFNSVYLVSLPANMLCVPLSTVVVGLMFVSALAQPVSEAAAQVLVLGADTVFSIVAMIVGFGASVPHAAVNVATPAVAGVACFYGALFFVAKAGRSPENALGAAAAVVLFLVISVYGHMEAAGVVRAAGQLNAEGGRLSVTFLSVGQGDSTVVRFPDGRTMLVDGGGLYGDEFDVGERLVAPYLWHEGITRVDYMVMTHAQRDHMAGLRFVAEKFGVGEFWYNGDAARGGVGEAGWRHESFDELTGALSAQGTVLRVVGTDTPPKEIGGATVEVLHPGADAGTDGLDVNGRSVVLRITYGQRSFLLTGDIGEEAEAILRPLPEMDADVLKAPHHGSRYSSTEGFLRAVNPKLVAVSAGRNNTFGFPHAESMDRYAGVGARVYRTDVDGAITVTTDGAVLEVSTYLTGKGR